MSMFPPKCGSPNGRSSIFHLTSDLGIAEHYYGLFKKKILLSVNVAKLDIFTVILSCGLILTLLSFFKIYLIDYAIIVVPFPTLYSPPPYTPPPTSTICL